MKEQFFNLDNNFCPDISQMKILYRKLFSVGKQLRASLTSTISKHLNIPVAQQKKLASAVEYIHHSSILHDDVIDFSPIRRGVLSTWMQFSMKKSILAGDYLMAQAAKDVADMENIELMKLTAQTIQKLVQGEWVQNSVQNQENGKNIQHIHELKTASLFQWCLRAPFLLINRYEKKQHQCLETIGLLMGILFQRSDDLLDFDIRNYENKQTLNDLKGGYLNSFAVYLLKDKPSDFKSLLKNCRQLTEVKNIFTQSEFEKALTDFDDHSKEYIQDCINKIKLLKQWLQPSEYTLIETLMKWPEDLYWRKSV